MIESTLEWLNDVLERIKLCKPRTNRGQSAVEEARKALRHAAAMLEKAIEAERDQPPAPPSTNQTPDIYPTNL